MTPVVDAHVESFMAARSELFAVAYRMLSTVADAEDVLQEAFVRWRSVDLGTVQTPAAYLTTVVTRLCLDVLKSARAQRETYVGPWLPEPLVSGAQGPEDIAELSDSLSMAFLIVLETLSPLQRAVFVLHDVFGYDHKSVAAIVGREEAAVRQLVSRARRQVAERRPRYDARESAPAALTERFRAACESGDLRALMGMLAADVVLLSDGGGRVLAARKPVVGAQTVARFLVRVYARRDPLATAEVTRINGAPGVVHRLAGVAMGAATLDVVDGRIVAVNIVRNPDKLTRLTQGPS